MYIGIDLGGTNMAVGLVDETGYLINKESVPSGRERTFSEVMKDGADLIRKLLSQNGVETAELRGIGMGAPGLVDPVQRIIFEEVNFPAFHNESPEEEMAKYFPGVPVYLENDANAAAYGEAVCGAIRDVADAVMITLGTGVGGGIIAGKKIYSGFNFAAGELGHMTLDINGPLCACGRRGCFETYASATALIRRTKEIMGQYPDSILHTLVQGDLRKVDGKVAFDAAKKGDAAGELIVSEFVEALAIGVANVINLLQPETIVIGGGISKEGDYLLSRLTPLVRQFSYAPKCLPATKLKMAELGNDAGIIGAAMLWKQES